MRVAVDARELGGRPTGVGRYLTGLLDAWSKSDAMRRHQWTLIAPGRLDGSSRWDATVEVAAGNGGTLWEQTALPRAARAARANVLFAPGYTAPLTVAAPLVLTIHDVSFFAHPEWFSFREGVRRRQLTAWSARLARTVITDTAFSKNEIARHIGVKHVQVIPLGIDQTARASNDSSTQRPPTVLFVGSLFQRRRVDRLIRAFDLVADRVADACLEIVGENRTNPLVDFEAIRAACRHRDRISIRSYVDDAMLASLYDRASVFAFLSEYEGFGLTPLEALAAGIPPIVLDTPVARETCDGAARYVSPSASNDDIAAAIADLLTSAEARRDVLAHRDTVLSRYDWDRAAAATLQVLEEAAGGQ
ncbi:MAG TPA: glycosyltransferase family 1 protein [Vicinamibacterales bacterium]|nr:glycosyltransferase family 1 protein [Vicinamibacterales bacterium]